MLRRWNSNDDTEGLNPYIALSDLAIGVLLVLVLFLVLGEAKFAESGKGSKVLVQEVAKLQSQLAQLEEEKRQREAAQAVENAQYREAERKFAEAVEKRIARADRPTQIQIRKDPPGVQRWAFSGSSLFMNGGSNDHPQLSPDGTKRLSEFAVVLKDFQSLWVRIRVEGHTLPPMQAGADNWELSAARAAVVARALQSSGPIMPWFFAVSGRAGQNHLCRALLCIDPNSPDLPKAQELLTTNGINYSIKSYGDTTAQKEVADLLKTNALVQHFYHLQETKQTALYVDVSEDTPPAGMEWRFIDDLSDSNAIATLTKQFRRNERVEILVEFFSPQSGALAPSGPAPRGTSVR